MPNAEILALYDAVVDGAKWHKWLRGADTAELTRLTRSVDRLYPGPLDIETGLDHLLRAGRLLQSGAGPADYMRAVKQVRAYKSALVELCRDPPHRETQMRARHVGQEHYAAVPVPASLSELGLDGDAGPSQELGSVTGIGLLFIALLGVFGSAFGLRYLGGLIFALRYHRRSCRIPAVLQIGAHRFDGTATILGRIGMRFVLADPDDFDHLQSVAETDDTAVRLGPFVAPAHIILVEDNSAALHYEVPASLAIQKQLLSLSIITPGILTRRRRLVPNIEQRALNRPARAIYADDRRKAGSSTATQERPFSTHTQSRS